MSWSFRIGRFFGIDVFIHATFLLLLIWVVGQTYFDTRNWLKVLDQLVFVVLVFVTVVLHEYGHALTARLFGIKTRDIILLPIGGVARLESMPEKPWQEILIAIAGPAVNVFLAVLCFIWWITAEIVGGGLVQAVAPPAQGEGVKSLFDMPLAFRLFFVNGFLALFNLIPAFPMDGGRVLRAVLALGLNYVRATQIAALIGQVVAVLFATVGYYIFRDPMLFLIALFVWVGAAQESRMVSLRAGLAGATVRQAMSTSFFTLYPFDTLELAAQKLVYDPQPEYPVVHGDQLVGLLSRNEISAAFSQLGGQRHVSEIMRREFPIARPDEMLLDVLPRLQQRRGLPLPVVEGDRLVGMLGINEVAQVMKGSGKV